MFNIKIHATDVSGGECVTSFILQIENKHPQSNPPSIQKQLELKVGNVQTGLYFGFQIDRNSITDDDEILVWSMSSADGIPLPSWLLFDRDNLLICGVPSDKSILKTYHLIITARDKYQSESQTLKILITPSAMYMAVTVIEFLGTLTSALTIYALRSTFYRLFCRRLYKPKG